MKYIFEFEQDEDSTSIDKTLKENYQFSLLNFASVVADVLAEQSFFSKGLGGRKKREIEQEISHLKNIKQNLIKELEKYFFRHRLNRLPDNFIKEVREDIGKEGENFYNSVFKLRPFFLELEKLISELGNELTKFNYENGFPKEILPMPFREGTLRNISYTNQICFLWATGMKDKDENVHWKKIWELLNWFIYHLDGSNYESKIEPILGGEDTEQPTEYVKRFFRKIKRKYFLSLSLRVAPAVDYFPFWDNKPHEPYFRLFVSDGGFRVFSIVSIKFYKNKIKIIFMEGKKPRTRETFLDRDKCGSIIRDYNSSEEKSEERLLLKIE